MRNIFSILTALTAVSITTSTVKAQAANVEPEALIAACAKAMTANTKIAYRDAAGDISKVSIGDVALRAFNQYHVLVEKKKPYMNPAMLNIVVSDKTPFIHDFEAPRDYFASATVLGIDWTVAKGLYVQAVLNLSIEDKSSGTTYQYSILSGKIPIVRKSTTPTSPVDVMYVAAEGAACAPSVDEASLRFYDMQTR